MTSYQLGRTVASRVKSAGGNTPYGSFQAERTRVGSEGARLSTLGKLPFVGGMFRNLASTKATDSFDRVARAPAMQDSDFKNIKAPATVPPPPPSVPNKGLAAGATAGAIASTNVAPRGDKTQVVGEPRGFNPGDGQNHITIGEDQNWDKQTRDDLYRGM